MSLIPLTLRKSVPFSRAKFMGKSVAVAVACAAGIAVSMGSILRSGGRLGPIIEDAAPLARNLAQEERIATSAGVTNVLRSEEAEF